MLTSLWTFGVIGGGVMLIMFVLRVLFCPVEVSALFLGLSSLSVELRCGMSFWLCSLFLLFIWRWRLRDGHHCSVPFELVKDGDLLLLLDRIFIFEGLTRFGFPK